MSKLIRLSSIIMALSGRKKTALKILPALVIVAMLLFFSRTGGSRRLIGGTVGVLAPVLRGAHGLALMLHGGLAEEASRTVSTESETSRFAREALMSENEILRRALGLKGETNGAIKTANILHASEAFGNGFLILDRGVDEGIGEGDIVVTSERVLVGMIQEAGAGFSKVALAANPGQVYDGEILPLGVHTLLRGVGAGTFSLDLIPDGRMVRRGDLVRVLVVGIAQGVLAAEVASVKTVSGGTFQEIHALALADPAGLGAVLIIPKSAAPSPSGLPVRTP
ncbi:MAG: rod shape-determining protein MreC [bacterium]|nr:rod shape-determining protein MreC [bacterium]MDZ4299497.1 rod shape-determining protein MreC [Candidatus Sungbacteria bacterium]